MRKPHKIIFIQIAISLILFLSATFSVFHITKTTELQLLGVTTGGLLNISPGKATLISEYVLFATLGANVIFVIYLILNQKDS